MNSRAEVVILNEAQRSEESLTLTRIPDPSPSTTLRAKGFFRSELALSPSKGWQIFGCFQI